MNETVPLYADMTSCPCSTLAAVATVLLLSASCADAAKRSFDDLSKGLNTKNSKSTKGSFSKSKTKRVSASAKCSSSAWASQYESHMDSYIQAGTCPL